MKARFIRGISRLPEVAGGISAGKIMGIRANEYPVTCLKCTHANWLKINKKTKTSNTCQGCHNCNLIISPRDMETVQSAIRIERYAMLMANSQSIRTIEETLNREIKNVRWRNYLSLGRTSMRPKINGRRVDTDVYHKMLRLMYMLIVPHSIRLIKMLIDNMVDISGAHLLHLPENLTRILGERSYDARLSNQEVYEITRAQRRGEQPRESISMSQLRAIFEIYDVDVFTARPVDVADEDDIEEAVGAAFVVPSAPDRDGTN